MALTNLASLDNVKSRIIAEKGISCFHFLQVQPCDDNDDNDDIDDDKGYDDDDVLTYLVPW